MKIYLAGKVNGNKWKLRESIQDKTIEFISSDGDKHSEHNYGFAYFGSYGDNNLKETVQEKSLSRIDDCYCLIAYLDEIDSFGSIAEIAYASTLGKKCFMIIVDPENKKTDIKEWKFYDSYWFISCFPHVSCEIFSNIEEAQGYFMSAVYSMQYKYENEVEAPPYANFQIEDVCRLVTKEDRYKVLSRQKWRCNICGTRLKYSINSDWEGSVAHIDHIWPYCKRESYCHGIQNINELSNLQALCPDCNLKKSKKEIN